MVYQELTHLCAFCVDGARCASSTGLDAPFSCSGVETRYIVRTLVRNLRVGANWRSVLSALGRASVVYEACHAPVTTAAPDVPNMAAAAASAPPPARRAALSKEALDAGATAAVDAFHRCPSLGRIVAALRAGGVGSLEATCGVATGIPLHPMLAKITEGFEDCVKQLTGQAALAEFKYDGQRAQIHVSESGEVRMSYVLTAYGVIFNHARLCS